MRTEMAEDMVIIGAGIAGLTTALGLHRMGLRSLVLESSDSLRVTGFALVLWTNAWKALDALGIGDFLREQHVLLDRLVFTSTISGLATSQLPLRADSKHESREVRSVKRNALVEALAKDLPRGTIRFSSKVVSIEEADNLKLLHLADGSILKTKVLIGCDGLNSVVAKWLGLEKPVSSGRWAIRGYAEYLGGHGLEPNFLQFFGNGSRCGLMPCDEKTVYWFFTRTPSAKYKEIEENPAMMKQFVLSNLGNVPEALVNAIESSDFGSIVASPLKFRKPWNVLWGEITKGNVCVAGDALHPMTPDIGQGGCAALEDGVVLARCLAEALLKEPGRESNSGVEDKEDEFNRIKMGLEKFAKERRWRSFELISTAYVVGSMQQSEGKVIGFLRDNLLSSLLSGLLLKKASYDCGKLNIS
ncbi:monooxygenase 2-like isoform X2 [Macadamia integrifolia]|uniref:monooxygenase 2-like isoform X2 n=1 Tax=Macadamia integrifolia TaxID=60698 RepID=UPI001C530425|nr:monooxygenase 2-like isoform X2 [Macadamia integrifolia]